MQINDSMVKCYYIEKEYCKLKENVLRITLLHIVRVYVKTKKTLHTGDTKSLNRCR